MPALNRIYVMGCGRSGTWLLTSLFSTFRDVEIFPDEAPVATFAVTETQKSVLVMKRDQNSYQAVEDIPRDIKIVWIVRHPFDVLTSYNPTTERKYHIKPHRWLGEMLALQYLIDTKRPDTKIIRYEDLVAEPAAVQAALACALELEIEAPVDQITSRFQPSELADLAMHGIRKIDTRSVGKFRDDPGKLAYLRSILPRLGRTLDWAAAEYSYNVNF